MAKFGRPVRRYGRKTIVCRRIWPRALLLATPIIRQDDRSSSWTRRRIAIARPTTVSPSRRLAVFFNETDRCFGMDSLEIAWRSATPGKPADISRDRDERLAERRDFPANRIVARLLNAAASWFNKELSIAEHYVTSIHP